MNSQKTTVIPFPAPSKSGSRYSAETEKRNNVIGTRLSEELKNRKLSKKEFCTTCKPIRAGEVDEWPDCSQCVPTAGDLLCAGS